MVNAEASYGKFQVSQVGSPYSVCLSSVSAEFHPLQLVDHLERAVITSISKGLCITVPFPAARHLLLTMNTVGMAI